MGSCIENVKSLIYELDDCDGIFTDDAIDIDLKLSLSKEMRISDVIHNYSSWLLYYKLISRNNYIAVDQRFYEDRDEIISRTLNHILNKIENLSGSNNNISSISQDSHFNEYSIGSELMDHLLSDENLNHSLKDED